jgi:hypothetical protein
LGHQKRLGRSAAEGSADDFAARVGAAIDGAVEGRALHAAERRDADGAEQWADAGLERGAGAADGGEPGAQGLERGLEAADGDDFEVAACRWDFECGEALLVEPCGLGGVTQADAA